MQGRPRRQDTFDLREQLQPGDARHDHQQYEMEHSVMEDSSDAEGEDFGDDSMDIIDHGYGAERNHDLDPDEHESDDAIGDYMSDSSSSLSIPNESIDFDLVYSLTNFAATVEGQASVVKGDSLFLMDDSNSYWWLVRVLKTQEVGYIPAENIETPFERLARLNRHRNVDLASATQAEIDSENPALSKSSKNRNRVQIDVRDGPERSNKRGVIFRPQSSIFRYPPAVWNEDDEDADVEWDENDIEIEQALVKDDTGRALDGSEIGDGDIVQIDMQADVHVEEHAIGGQGAPERGLQDNVPLALRPGGAGPVGAQGAQAASQAIVQQQSQQQQQTQMLQMQQQQQQQQESQLRSQTSQERPQEEQANRIMLDPAQATETKRVVITPSVAREDQVSPQSSAQQQQATGRSQQPGPLLPSEIIEKRQQELEQERKRAREEIEAVEEARKRSTKGRSELGLGPPPVQAQGSPTKELTRTPSQETRSSVTSSNNTGGKLRKERSDRDSEESEKDSGRDKKKKGVFAGLFGRKKDKDKSGKASIENLGAAAADARQRGSEDSALSSSQHSHGHSPYPGSPGEGARGSLSPAPGSRAQAQQQQRGGTPTSISQPQGTSPTPSATSQPQQPISTLRERDQQQQALYQQYLKRSPSSPPEQPSYATQSASLVMPLNNSPNSSGYGLGLAPITQPFRTQGGRPGSLILSPAPGTDGQGSFGVPELSVIRVFAGPNIQSDATFKTVLLNSSTTSGDLVRQAMQRFRLAAGENAADYYLTVKQMEGSTLKLRPEEKPLGVFEQLVEEAMEMPKVKRSSVGSISSIASNLSAHPAIRKLPMNDFTDDSAVKFYLNRRGGEDTSVTSEDGTLSPDSSTVVESDSSMMGEARGRYLSASSSATSSVSPDRFSSPSVRFGLQLVIYKDELPDSMVFDPHTEAIVFKDTLRERSQSSASVNPSVPQNLRKKYFNFPKNITVAEVIELGLDRFGIVEGVVDGGDEVEDKLTKRRSSTRVRYILTVKVNEQERELPLSSKVVDAFPRPPTFRRSTELRRRSVDSAQLLLGSTDDVQPDDPVFILRRAVAYRPTNTSRHHHRLSAPLDELALSHLHRDSASSDGSTGMIADDRNKAQARQPSRQEIIAAQRAASRANQRALLSTQVNAQRGVDVVLPDRAVLRSQRPGGADDDRVRYSYVQPDGETVDVSDIVEAELRASNSGSPGGSSSLGDLLSGAVNGAQGNALINRVIDKINSKSSSVAQSSSTSTVQTAVSIDSAYSEDDDATTMTENAESRTTTPTPTATNFASQLYNPARSMSPSSQQAAADRSRSVTPTAGGFSSTSTSSSSVNTHHAYQPSIESMMSMSDISDYRTAASGTPLAMASSRSALQTPSSPIPEPDLPDTKPYKIPKDEFGVGHMLAIIETKAALSRPSPPSPSIKQMDEVDRLFFGTKIDVEGLHPKIREVYGDSLKRMNDIDVELDNLIRKTLHIF